jgi:hypothetical protein
MNITGTLPSDESDQKLLIFFLKPNKRIWGSIKREGPEEVNWELGLAFFLPWENGICLSGNGIVPLGNGINLQMDL